MSNAGYDPNGELMKFTWVTEYNGTTSSKIGRSGLSTDAKSFLVKQFIILFL